MTKNALRTQRTRARRDRRDGRDRLFSQSDARKPELKTGVGIGDFHGDAEEQQSGASVTLPWPLGQLPQGCAGCRLPVARAPVSVAPDEFSPAGYEGRRSAACAAGGGRSYAEAARRRGVGWRPWGCWLLVVERACMGAGDGRGRPDRRRCLCNGSCPLIFGLRVYRSRSRNADGCRRT